MSTLKNVKFFVSDVKKRMYAQYIYSGSNFKLLLVDRMLNKMKRHICIK
jgi:hypothetical protein